MNFSQCNKILFGFHGTLRYPTNDTWTKADSSFINNRDTIYFKIIHRGILRIEGYKLPEREAVNEIKFYNSKLRLYKIEYWKEAFGANHENEYGSWSETSAWQAKKVFERNDTYKLFERSVQYSEKKKWMKVTKVYQYANNEIWPIRTKYRKM